MVDAARLKNRGGHMKKDAKTASHSFELDEDGPVRPSGQTRTDGGNVDDRSAVVGNERMTALAGAVLLVLILVDLVTAASLRTLLSAHVFVGVLLAGPLAVKIASTGYRLLRYYTRSPAFVRKGPPRLALRLLAPPLLTATLVVVGSGVGLLVALPTQTAVFVHGILVLT